MNNQKETIGFWTASEFVHSIYNDLMDYIVFVLDYIYSCVRNLHYSAVVCL